MADHVAVGPEARWTPQDATILKQLLEYQDEHSALDTFPDPKVVAALVTSQGKVLARYRKSRADETHSEARVILDLLRRTNKCDLAASLESAWYSFNYRLHSPTDNHRHVAQVTSQLFQGDQQAQQAFAELTLYVTLEPCAHGRRTPPCTGLICGAGIRRVVFLVGDNNPDVAGKGMDALNAAGVTVISAADGVLAAEPLARILIETAVRSNREFYAATSFGRRMVFDAIPNPDLFQEESTFPFRYAFYDFEDPHESLCWVVNVAPSGRAFVEVVVPGIDYRPLGRLTVTRAARRRPPTDLQGALDQHRRLYVNVLNTDAVVHALKLEREQGPQRRCPARIIACSNDWSHDLTPSIEEKRLYLRSLTNNDMRVDVALLDKLTQEAIARRQVLQLSQDLGKRVAGVLLVTEARRDPLEPDARHRAYTRRPLIDLSDDEAEHWVRLMQTLSTTDQEGDCSILGLYLPPGSRWYDSDCTLTRVVTTLEGRHDRHWTVCLVPGPEELPGASLRWVRSGSMEDEPAHNLLDLGVQLSANELTAWYSKNAGLASGALLGDGIPYARVPDDLMRRPVDLAWTYWSAEDQKDSTRYLKLFKKLWRDVRFKNNFDAVIRYPGDIVRVSAVQDEKIGLQPALYEDQVMTNHSLDLLRIKERTLREVAGLRDMGKTLLADGIGVACLIMSSDSAILTIRSHRVGVYRHTLSASCAGHAKPYPWGGTEATFETFLRLAMARELLNELGLVVDIEKLQVLGLARDLRLGGKLQAFFALTAANFEERVMMEKVADEYEAIVSVPVRALTRIIRSSALVVRSNGEECVYPVNEELKACIAYATPLLPNP